MLDNDTRVKLGGEQNDYINASHINIELEKISLHYILSQGPKLVYTLIMIALSIPALYSHIPDCITCAPRIIILSYPGYAYPCKQHLALYIILFLPGMYLLVPRIFISSYPGYLSPRTPDIYLLVPRIFISSYPGYLSPRYRILIPVYPEEYNAAFLEDGLARKNPGYRPPFYNVSDIPIRPVSNIPIQPFIRPYVIFPYNPSYDPLVIFPYVMLVLSK